MTLRDRTESFLRSLRGARRPRTGSPMMGVLRGPIRTLTLVLLPLAAPACTRELGDCDAEAARELVYGQNGLVATKGQALLHDSCGNAAFCHSRGAAGRDRHGAPAGMDFDMLPVPSGWTALVEQREDVWSSVLDGQMPPSMAGASLVGNSDWTTDPYRRAESARLPTLTTAAGKAALRNWLACGAPVVGDSLTPSWARPPGEVDHEASWSEIYTKVITPNCATAGCHNAFAAGDLALTDACTAYRQLLAPATAECGGEPRLVPGDTNSLLLDKLVSREPRCGAPMPTSGPLPSPELETIRAWISRGAPASCP